MERRSMRSEINRNNKGGAKMHIQSSKVGRGTRLAGVFLSGLMMAAIAMVVMPFEANAIKYFVLSPPATSIDLGTISSEDAETREITLTDWFCSGSEQIAEMPKSLTDQNKVRAKAEEVLKNAKSNAVRFWDKLVPHPVDRIGGLALTAPGAGQSRKVTVKGCYTLDELKSMKRAVIRWAKFVLKKD